ncbi:hypothetical protein CALCODRAFT_198241 [Calocera cornea HHB12733]|uniref:Uncharacterized protein n=1 Tax=Calocera cornea HHB12733 TaxID=1353952 RepID=A0A165HFJ1_9BASI|nr:hypothetical protein CALCODRAFT_198241 [Calocera cornea HHB12733]
MDTSKAKVRSGDTHQHPAIWNGQMLSITPQFCMSADAVMLLPHRSEIRRRVVWTEDVIENAIASLHKVARVTPHACISSMHYSDEHTIVIRPNGICHQRVSSETISQKVRTEGDEHFPIIECPGSFILDSSGPSGWDPSRPWDNTADQKATQNGK